MIFLFVLSGLFFFYLGKSVGKQVSCNYIIRGNDFEGNVFVLLTKSGIVFTDEQLLEMKRILRKQKLGFYKGSDGVAGS